MYSRKMFLYGLPPEIRKEDIIRSLHRFGFIKMHWPRSDGESRRCLGRKYLPIVFKNINVAQSMLDICIKNGSTLRYCFAYCKQDEPTKVLTKWVKVIPWNTDDNCCISNNGSAQEHYNLVVGRLPMSLTAADLVEKLNLAVGPISQCRYFTDRYQYPQGKAVITISSLESYQAILEIPYLGLQVSKHINKLIKFKPFNPILNNY